MELKRMTHWCIAIAAVTFLVYLSSLGNAFVSLDDGLLIYKNPLVHRIDFYTLKRIFTSYDPELYIPFPLLLYQIQHAIFGLNSTVFHLTNLLLHIANALLVVWVINMISRKRWMGIAAGLFFALHPLHTEAVAWASATKDLLSGLFFLLSLGFYLRFLDSGNTKNLRRSTITFALGLFSKVVIIFTPIVLLLLDHMHGRGINKRTIKEKRWHFVLSILFGIIAIAGRAQKPQVLNLLEIKLLSAKSIVFYIQKLFLPSNLSVLYPQGSAISLNDPVFIFAILIVLGLIGLLIWSFKRAPKFCFGLGFFLLILAPNFVNFSKNGYLFFASDRYAYLPSIGIIFIFLMIADKLITNRKKAQIGSVIGLIIVAIFAISTRSQSLIWKDTESLNQNILRQYPDSTMAMNNLGSIRFAEENYNEAIELFERAYEIDANNTSSINIGLVSLQRGNISKAEEWFRKAIDAIPGNKTLQADDVIPYYFLADLREKMGFSDEALELYKEAASKGNTFAEPHINLGIAYQKRNLSGEAEKEFRLAIGLNPYFPTPHYHLAGILAESGDLSEAQNELRKVLHIDPEYENAKRHLHNIEQMIKH